MHHRELYFEKNEPKENLFSILQDFYKLDSKLQDRIVNKIIEISKTLSMKDYVKVFLNIVDYAEKE